MSRCDRGITRRFTFLLLLGLVIRWLVQAWSPPCDDVWRYFWEGDLLRRGGDPWLHAPAEFLHARVTDSILIRVNHPQFPAIYPGLLVGLFALLRAASGQILALRGMLIAVELGTALWIRKLSRLDGGSGDWAFAIAWLSPLAIWEVSGRAHFEPLLEICLLGWSVFSRAGRPLVAGAFLGASIQIKTVGGIVLGIVDGLRSPVKALPSLLTLLLVFALVACFAPSSLLGMWRTGLRFGTEFESNDFLPYLLHAIGLAAWIARAGSALLLLGILYRIGRAVADPFERAGHALFWTLACLPTFHAWYALWLLPYVALRPRAWSLVFLVSSLAYEFAWWHSGGHWVEWGWVRWAIWVPPMTIYLVSLCASTWSFLHSMKKEPLEAS